MAQPRVGEKTSIRFDEDTRSKLDYLANLWRVSRGAVVRRLVKEALIGHAMGSLRGYKG